MRTLFVVAFLVAVAFAASPTYSDTVVNGYYRFYYDSGCGGGDAYRIDITIDDNPSVPFWGCNGNQQIMTFQYRWCTSCWTPLPLSLVIEQAVHDKFGDDFFYASFFYENNYYYEEDTFCQKKPVSVTLARSVGSHHVTEQADNTGRDRWLLDGSWQTYLDGICNDASFGHRGFFKAVKTYYPDNKCSSAPVARMSWDAGYIPPYQYADVICDKQDVAYSWLYGSYATQVGTTDYSPYVDFGKLFGDQRYLSRIDFTTDNTCKAISAFAAYDADCVLYNKDEPYYLGASNDVLYYECRDPKDCPGSANSQMPMSLSGYGTDACTYGGNYIFHLPGEQDHALGQCTASLCAYSSTSCAETSSCLTDFCIPLTEKNCDDQNPCTIDQCQEGYGCRHRNNVGITCTPADLCTINAVCAINQNSGIAECQGEQKVCTGDQCNDASCDSLTGNCVLTPKKNPPAICLSSSSGALNAGSSLAASFSMLSLALFSLFAFVF